MIIGCYTMAGMLTLATGLLFAQGALTATTQSMMWAVTYFFASAAGSAAYLTVSEVFPMEIRAMAIALFYAVATALGGISGPILYGRLIETKDPFAVFSGFAVAAGLMLAGALTELVLGIKAEQQSLEIIAAPLTAI
jgi:hypothetical protein